ncbi:30S ribosomal protein S6 [Candidatus Pelagibacter sp.]|nr:30S ribosomal protein S6 [Candidatus Pelagibacter sp.]
MNLYEHTIVARQDTSPAQINQLTEKYSKIVEKNEGEIVQTEDWGLLNLAYIIKKNKKGIYMHFKIKGSGKIIYELEKNEAIDKNLLRYMTVKVKKFNLEAKYFSKKDEYEKKEYKKEYKREYNRD